MTYDFHQNLGMVSLLEQRWGTLLILKTILVGSTYLIDNTKRRLCEYTSFTLSRYYYNTKLLN